MYASLNLGRVGVCSPGEEGAKGEVLDDRKFGQYFGVVHFDHALY